MNELDCDVVAHEPAQQLDDVDDDRFQRRGNALAAVCVNAFRQAGHVGPGILPELDALQDQVARAGFGKSAGEEGVAAVGPDPARKLGVQLIADGGSVACCGVSSLSLGSRAIDKTARYSARGLQPGVSHAERYNPGRVTERAGTALSDLSLDQLRRDSRKEALVSQWLGDVTVTPGGADPLLVPLHRKSRKGDHRDRASCLVCLQ